MSGIKKKKENTEMPFSYSIVKDSSADLGVNFKIVQNRPTVKAVSHSRFRHYFCSNLYGSAPRGPRGVKKSDFFFSQIKLLSFCANIAPKRHKLRKTIKIEKKM